MLYKFKKPFQYGKENVESVELKESFNTGDMIRITNEKQDGDRFGAILVAATGWPLPKVAEIPFEDSTVMAELLVPFIEAGVAGGAQT